MAAPGPAKEISRTRAYNAEILRFTHTSRTLSNLSATFTAILPPSEPSEPSPVLYWLSGLTCTDQNFVIKSAPAQYATKHSVAIICPDTSPRGAGAPEEDDNWDFGTGAGFYVNATEKGYEAYQMADYVVNELPTVVRGVLGGRVDTSKAGISGHSMGGMGALSLALRNPGLYKSVSAFAPNANPMRCPWGQKCFTGYLGLDQGKWKEYDPTELMKKRSEPLCDNIMIEQGAVDEYLETQLMPDRFVEACKEVGQKVELTVAEGYDHSYFFVQTFLDKHMAFHAKALRA